MKRYMDIVTLWMKTPLVSFVRLLFMWTFVYVLMSHLWWNQPSQNVFVISYIILAVPAMALIEIICHFIDSRIYTYKEAIKHEHSNITTAADKSLNRKGSLEEVR